MISSQYGGYVLSPSSRTLLLVGVSATIAWATPLHAQNAPAPAGTAASDVEYAENAAAITVTARKREEKIQDVPLSISTIGRETVENEQLTQIQDFAQKIANFNPRTSNPRTSALSIRGAGGLSSAGDGSEGGVGLIVDNVFYTHIGFVWGPLYDVAGIEVARGPQGTLLGKNTTIGAVIVRTNAPSFDADNQVEVSAGNYGSLTTRGYSTGTLVDDRLAYRISFYREKNDGFYPNNWPPLNDNRRAENRMKDTNRWAIRGQLLAKIGDNITSRLIVDYHQSKEFNNYSGIVESPFTQYANGTPVETYAQKINRLFGIANIDYNPYTAELTNPSRMQQSTRGVSNELTWDLGGLTLTSVTAWRQFRLYPRNTQGNNGLYLYSLGYDIVADQYSQELRLASPVSDVFDYQVGAYFLRDVRTSNDRIIFGQQAAQFYNNSATTNPDVLNGLEYDQLGKAKTTSLAAFGQATWHVTPWFDLTGGLRFTHEERSGSNTASSFGGADTLSAPNLAIRNKLLLNQFGGYFTVSGKKKNDSISWLINPSVKISDDILLYASTAKGVKSGAINTVAVPIYVGTTLVDYQDVVVKPERSRDWELGLKTSWFDKTLLFNINLYWNDIYNYQGNVTDTTSYKDAQGSVVAKTYLGNIAHVRLKGVEVESHWQATKSLQLNLAGAITDVRYVKYDDAAPPADYRYSGGPNTISQSGNKIEAIPPWILNIGVNYDHPVGNLGSRAVNGFLYVNESIQGKTQYLPSVSSYQLTQDTYGITNVGVGVRREDDTLRVTLWSKNLFDKKYTTAQTLGTTSAAATQGLGDPRTFGATVAAKF